LTQSLIQSAVNPIQIGNVRIDVVANTDPTASKANTIPAGSDRWKSLAAGLFIKAQTVGTPALYPCASADPRVGQGGLNRALDHWILNSDPQFNKTPPQRRRERPNSDFIGYISLQTRRQT
jgi:hypothetical protein